MSRRLPSVCAAIFVGVVAFYLLTEHTQHTLGALPYLLFLLCPLMHLFMHRGHGSGGKPDEGGPHAHH
ncbi:MAG: DUF2933 domain-containing protein [Myxococcota bacterium]